MNMDNDNIPLGMLYKKIGPRTSSIKHLNEDDIPIAIIKRRLYIKNMIIKGNDMFKEETKKSHRKYVMNCGVYLKIQKVKIDESKNMIKLI